MKHVLGLLLLLAAAAPQPPPPAADAALRGFTPERSAWQRDYERRLLALPKPAECDALLRELTREPHVAGTPGNERVARFIADEFRKAGLEVTTPTYDVLLSYPKSAPPRDRRRARSRARRGPRSRSPRTPTRPSRRRCLPWNAYAPSADLTGRGRLRQPRRGRGLRPARRDGHRRAGQDRARALLRRLPRRQVARGREARRRGDPRLFRPDRRRLVQGRGLPGRAPGARSRTSSAAPTSTTSSSRAIR